MTKIVAAFRGMHVSPAKYSFGKCDQTVWQTDRQTDGQTDGRLTKWSLCVTMLRRGHNKNGQNKRWKAPDRTYFMYDFDIENQNLLSSFHIGTTSHCCRLLKTAWSVCLVERPTDSEGQADSHTITQLTILDEWDAMLELTSCSDG